MKFDEQNKVLIDTLNPVEARAYINFLLEEEMRHFVCLREAKAKARIKFLWDNEYWEAWGKFWESAVSRHEEDILDIKALIEKARELFE